MTALKLLLEDINCDFMFVNLQVFKKESGDCKVRVYGLQKGAKNNKKNDIKPPLIIIIIVKKNSQENNAAATNTLLSSGARVLLPFEIRF